jgi:hypothetical protein
MTVPTVNVWAIQSLPMNQISIESFVNDTRYTVQLSMYLTDLLSGSPPFMYRNPYISIAIVFS